MQRGNNYEVVFEGLLRRRGDDQDVFDPCGDRLLDDVLNGRPIDDGQHLLGDRLGRGKEAGSETSRRDHGLSHGGHGRSVGVAATGRSALGPERRLLRRRRCGAA